MCVREKSLILYPLSLLPFLLFSPFSFFGSAFGGSLYF
ncbi:hypothetical protein CWATWH0402_323 [Crocosphaera watsonii WH 0402]|uniref:Uncharacterized protein n=3 Tax=Crocosphaera watsonii TaxID=263511 RepID=T2JSC2_CROWT|nr:hypothetical protein CWATWH0003_4636 [Crocosphaera watsonii WH 0003]CCQ60808.1 hypothetical protein CWATWH0401_1917 [Crocosphaera watsonii WH 0401]CCQ67934.1 hypothetical protein CWATWH0402_323 [Crocosphaera watsonii WH 0402]